MGRVIPRHWVREKCTLPRRFNSAVIHAARRKRLRRTRYTTKQNENGGWEVTTGWSGCLWNPYPHHGGRVYFCAEKGFSFDSEADAKAEARYNSFIAMSALLGIDSPDAPRWKES